MAQIVIACGNCNHQLEIDERMINQTVQCPNCQAELLIQAELFYGNSISDNQYETPKSLELTPGLPKMVLPLTPVKIHFSELFSKTFGMYISTFKAQMAWVGISVLFSLLIFASIVGGLAGLNMLIDMDALAIYINLIQIGIVVFSAIILLVSLYFTTWAIKHMLMIGRGIPKKISECRPKSGDFGRFFRASLVFMLYNILMCILMIAVCFACIAGASVLSNIIRDNILLISVVGIIAAIISISVVIYGFYEICKRLFMPYLAVDRAMTVGESFRESPKYIKKNIGCIFANSIVISLIFMVITSIIAIPLIIINVSGGNEYLIPVTIISNGLRVLVQLLVIIPIQYYCLPITSYLLCTGQPTVSK